MKVFFLSDLHLDNGTSVAALRFGRFLASEPQRGDILLLGGDIFDLLVGNKRVFRSRFAPVLKAITEAGARGVQVHYLEGNHDFHFAGMFRGQSNVQIHTADFSIPERAIWVSHGDLIDPDDTGYRFLRFVTKNAPFRAFVWSMPEALVDFIGSRSSGASRKYTTGRVENEGTERLRRIYLEFARAKVKDGYRHVLVGHSHLRDQIAIDGGEYVNLGFSADKLNVAVLDEGAAAFRIREIS